MLTEIYHTFLNISTKTTFMACLLQRRIQRRIQIECNENLKRNNYICESYFL